MKTLTIFFDARCGLCCRFSRWLMTQPARVSIRFLPYDSTEALEMFPLMHEVRADRDIVVLADDGRWWQGAGAWITCLWATRDYRDWSFRLAKPALRPLVSKAVHLLSENRLRLSTMLRLQSDSHLASVVSHTEVRECPDGTCTLSPSSARLPVPNSALTNPPVKESPLANLRSQKAGRRASHSFLGMMIAWAMWVIAAAFYSWSNIVAYAVGSFVICLAAWLCVALPTYWFWRREGIWWHPVVVLLAGGLAGIAVGLTLQVGVFALISGGFGAVNAVAARWLEERHLQRQATQNFPIPNPTLS